MEIIIIKRESPEWETMWNWLANHPINSGLEEPSVAVNDQNGEAWQYMGSFRQGNRVISEFRHRMHPVTQKRELVPYGHPDGVPDDQIEKVVK